MRAYERACARLLYTGVVSIPRSSAERSAVQRRAAQRSATLHTYGKATRHLNACRCNTQYKYILKRYKTNTKQSRSAENTVRSTLSHGNTSTLRQIRIVVRNQCIARRDTAMHSPWTGSTARMGREAAMRIRERVFMIADVRSWAACRSFLRYSCCGVSEAFRGG